MTTAMHLKEDERRRRREQQYQLAAYMTDNDGGVVGFGDTRLGEDASFMAGLTRRSLSKRGLRSERA